MLQQLGRFLNAGALFEPGLEGIRIRLGHHVLVHRLVQEPVHGVRVGGNGILLGNESHLFGPVGQPLLESVRSARFEHDLGDTGAGFALRRFGFCCRDREVGGKARISRVSDRLLTLCWKFGLLPLVGGEQGAGRQCDGHQDRNGGQRRPSLAESCNAGVHRSITSIQDFSIYDVRYAHGFQQRDRTKTGGALARFWQSSEAGFSGIEGLDGWSCSGGEEVSILLLTSSRRKNGYA